MPAALANTSTRASAIIQGQTINVTVPPLPDETIAGIIAIPLTPVANPGWRFKEWGGTPPGWVPAFSLATDPMLPAAAYTATFTAVFEPDGGGGGGEGGVPALDYGYVTTERQQSAFRLIPDAVYVCVGATPDQVAAKVQGQLQIDNGPWADQAYPDEWNWFGAVPTDTPGTYTITGKSLRMVNGFIADSVELSILKINFKANELIRPLYEQTLDAETWLTDDTFDKTRITWSITKVEGVNATIDQDGDVTFGQGAGIYTVRAESSDLSTCYDEFTLMVLDWVLGAHSNAGLGDSMTAGHAWITITDFSVNPATWVGLGLYADTSTTIVNLGLANGDGTDVRTIDGAYGRYNRYFFLNPQEKKALATYISPVRHWTYWYTCASFSEGAVMAATGEDVDADDILGFETPREFGESIQQLEASDPTSRLNPLNGGQVDNSSASSSFPNP